MRLPAAWLTQTLLFWGYGGQSERRQGAEGLLA